ncbi:DUF7507 domain-containing protein [Curtobacterium sp. Leaf261]|uniref:DUF7507 domain-containing protein n=1 Tax=Curtobacterium sp. Leaf261 TaxID=1736311 RepID=UPI0006FFA5B7|nr:hypothetical protein [Curtobacterium sp. Leaf261]KQO61357.1 hypothetical protein ASF23_12830 [Curtobacterium sp. Leaf261]
MFRSSPTSARLHGGIALLLFAGIAATSLAPAAGATEPDAVQAAGATEPDAAQVAIDGAGVAPTADRLSGPLQNSAKTTFVGIVSSGWTDTVATPTTALYPAPGDVGVLEVGGTCVRRNTSATSSSLEFTSATIPASCLRFRSELTAEGFFTFRVDDDGAPANGRYLGDGNSGGWLDLLSTTPLVLFAVPEAPAGTVRLAGALRDTNGDGVTNAGDTVVWSGTVENTGNVRLRDLALQLDPSTTITCDPSTVDAGASRVCRSQAVRITQADMERGSLRATVTGTATSPGGAAVALGTASATVPLAGAASLTGTLTSDLGTAPAAGDRVTYTATVRNTGSLRITGLTLEPSAGTLGACDAAALAPGAERSCTITRTLRQADLDAGVVPLDVAVRGTAAGGESPSTTLSISDALEQRSTATVSLRSDASGAVEPGDPVAYTTTVRNTGNTTLSGLRVTASIGAARPCSPAVLAPGGSATCAIAYTVTDADADAGTIVQRATVSGAVPSGDRRNLGSASVTDQVRGEPGATATVVSDAAAVPAVGDRITSTVTITNSGAVTLTDVALDPVSGSAAPCATTTLTRGASTTCAVTGEPLTQADVDRGSVRFVADVLGTSPQGDRATLTTARHTDVVPATATAAATMTTDAGDAITVGQVVTARTEVRNTGNVTLSGLGVTTATTAGVCAPRTIAPGASATCRTTHTVTQADVDRGTVPSSAIVSGSAPDAAAAELVRASHDDVVVAAPAITTGTVSDIKAEPSVGDVVTWTSTIENTGNVTLSDIELVGATCERGDIAPGRSTTCTAAQTITQADLDAGSVHVAGDVFASTPAGVRGVLGTIDRTDPIAQRVAADVSSGTDAAAQPAVDDVVTDTVTVANLGNVTITDLSLTPDRGTVDPCDTAPLEPGGSRDCTVRTTVTQDDVDAGGLTVDTVVRGSSPTESGIELGRTAARVVVPAQQAATLAVVADIGDGIAVGQDVVFSAEVVNTGNVTLHGLALADADDALECPTGPLAPGATTTCDLRHTVTQAEVDAAVVTATITGGATTPAGVRLDLGAPEIRLPVTAAPSGRVSLAIESGSGHVVGSEVTFVATVENLGNVTMHDLVVDHGPGTSGEDAAPTHAAPTHAAPTHAAAKDAASKHAAATDAAATCTTTTIAPATAAECRFIRTLTQDDVDAGLVSEVASADVTTPAGERLTLASANATETIAPEISADIRLSADATPPLRQGQTVTFTTSVENTGTVTLHGLSARDQRRDTAQECAATVLAPGTSTTCTETRTVSATDVDAGRLAVVYDVSAVTPDDERHEMQHTEMELETETPRVLAFTGTVGLAAMLALVTALVAVGFACIVLGRRITAGTRRHGRRAAR